MVERAVAGSTDGGGEWAGMTTGQALAELGVRENTLTDDERLCLDEDGFLPLPNLISEETIRRMRERVDELARIEGEEAGKEVHQETGTDRLSDLVNKDPVFGLCFTQPRVLAAVAHVLGGDLKLSSLNSRAALPGQGLQALHVDWNGSVPPGEYQVCNSIWLLDDFTEENGATRVVPGSHRWQTTPRDGMEDPCSRHPQEVILTAPAGTVVVFNSHTWHGGTLNRSLHPRRALHSYFCRRHQPQQLCQREYIRPGTYERLSPAARFVLDVEGCF